MHQLYKTFFSSYSDLYYKTRSLGNLLLSVNYYPNFIIISNMMTMAIRTTVVPIRILIRTTVVPIRILIRTTAIISALS